MNQGNSETPNLAGLTARQIFEKIVKGHTVRIPNDPILANQLKNHLNVIKSREKKYFLDLGLDFISSVISVTEIKEPFKLLNPKDNSVLIIPGQFKYLGYDIKLVAPKIRRKYTAFVIKDDDEQVSNAI